MTMASLTIPARFTAGQCMFLLCQSKAKGLIRMQVFTKPESTTPDIREVPMCEPCADDAGEAFRGRKRLHLTPGGAVYVGDLDHYLPRKPRHR